MCMLSTIQPVIDVDNGYGEMEAQHDHRDKTGYPEEVLLLSLLRSIALPKEFAAE